jgi:hypothetical protein
MQSETIWRNLDLADATSSWLAQGETSQCNVKAAAAT